MLTSTFVLAIPAILPNALGQSHAGAEPPIAFEVAPQTDGTRHPWPIDARAARRDDVYRQELAHTLYDAAGVPRHKQPDRGRAVMDQHRLL